MKSTIILTILLLTSGCETIQRSGEMVEEIGGSIEKTGQKHNESILGKGAEIGGRVYRHVGGAIKRISGKDKKVSVGGALLEVTDAAIDGLSGTSTDKTVITEVQRVLLAKGYDLGKPDGIFGKKTAVALMGFQKDNGLSTTGKIDAPTRSALGL